MDKEEIKDVIAEIFKNLNVNKVDSININNGTYDDGSAYTEVTITTLKEVRKIEA